jgi:nucleotidyltransferase substrate binding protein (TIGR01987 family)
MKNKNTQDPNNKKLVDSIAALEHALSFEKKAHDDPFYFAGITKSFETCLEYAWKYMKRRAQEEGLDIYSPKEAIKAAGRMELIDDVEMWLDFLEDRNLSVHDYLGVEDSDYLETIHKFFRAVKTLTE